MRPRSTLRCWQYATHTGSGPPCARKQRAFFYTKNPVNSAQVFIRKDAAMLDALFASALDSQPFTVVAFLLAIVALWTALKKAQASRVTAIEAGLKKCLAKHDKCEQRNQRLVLAVVDAAQGRGADAMVRCREILSDIDTDGG